VPTCGTGSNGIAMRPVDKPSTSYSPRSDATLEGERVALGNVYRFILDRQECKKGGRTTAPDDAEESKNDRTDTCIIPDRI
jgi:hypothetical protein